MRAEWVTLQVVAPQNWLVVTFAFVFFKTEDFQFSRNWRLNFVDIFAILYFRAGTNLQVEFPANPAEH